MSCGGVQRVHALHMHHHHHAHHHHHNNNRSFLLRLIDAMTALGRPVYVASFGLKEWVLPVAELVLGDKVPVENIYALDGHPPRFPVVLNKNLWLADVMEKHGMCVDCFGWGGVNVVVVCVVVCTGDDQ